MSVSLFLKLVMVAFLLASVQYLSGCNPPSPRNPIVEVAADIGCSSVQIGITENGEPIRVTCEGKWKNAHKNPTFRTMPVCPLYMRERRLCGDEVAAVASGPSSGR